MYVFPSSRNICPRTIRCGRSSTNGRESALLPALLTKTAPSAGGEVHSEFRTAASSPIPPFCRIATFDVSPSQYKFLSYTYKNTPRKRFYKHIQYLQLHNGIERRTD